MAFSRSRFFSICIRSESRLSASPTTILSLSSVTFHNCSVRLGHTGQWRMHLQSHSLLACACWIVHAQIQCSFSPSCRLHLPYNRSKYSPGCHRSLLLSCLLGGTSQICVSTLATRVVWKNQRAPVAVVKRSAVCVNHCASSFPTTLVSTFTHLRRSPVSFLYFLPSGSSYTFTWYHITALLTPCRVYWIITHASSLLTGYHFVVTLICFAR